jgi:hypothetical protein
MKNSLGIVELYSEHRYGRTRCTAKDIDSHYMLVYQIKLNEFYDNSYRNLLYDIIKYRQSCLNNCKNSNKLEIIEIIELPSLEQVGIIKTIWLKLFQHKVKKYLARN